jgi:hypothetical protein
MVFEVHGQNKLDQNLSAKHVSGQNAPERNIWATKRISDKMYPIQNLSATKRISY